MAIAAHEPVSLIWLWIAFLSFATIRWLICFMCSFRWFFFSLSAVSIWCSSYFFFVSSFALHSFFFICCWSLALFHYVATRRCLCGVLHSLSHHHTAYGALTGSGVNSGNSENENTNSSGQYQQYLYTHNNDEPPHFNLRFTAPDYNNSSNTE